MKKLLLSAGLVLSFIPMTLTAAPDGEGLKTRQQTVHVNKVNNRASEDRVVKQLAPGITVTVINGKKHLHNLYETLDTPSKLDLTPKARAAKAALPEGCVLFEGAEDWDGTTTDWIPEGWSLEMKGQVVREESWIPVAPGRWDPQAAEGQYYFKIQWGKDVQDEWLISPCVEIAEDMELDYWLYLDPMFLYVIDSEHIDWNTSEFINREVAANLQVLIQVEGEDWVTLRDYAEEYKDYTYRELTQMGATELEKQAVSLKDYYGKKVRVAFRYAGEDGDAMCIDAISIGYPVIENVTYSSPVDMQFWGMSTSPSLLRGSLQRKTDRPTRRQCGERLRTGREKETVVTKTRLFGRDRIINRRRPNNHSVRTE